MINNIKWFKIIAGKFFYKIPEFCTKNTRLHNKTMRLWPGRGQFRGRGQSFEAEAKILASGHFGLEDLTSLLDITSKLPYRQTRD